MAHPTVPRNEWRCIRNLGQGSFGVVELWKNNKTGKMNAVKRFEIRKSGQQSSDKMVEELKKLWKKEVELMTTIQHCPYIVSAEPVPEDVIEKMTSGGKGVTLPPILFMEYCAGGNLRNVLKLPENICGLRETDVLTILDNMSQAITFLHDIGLIHRDLKPDNILRYIDPNNRVIYKLSDLGFAQNQCNTTNTFVGTPQYLAPEIYQGKSYDRTVDYWSFGVIAFEICTGIRPFLHGESPTNWLPLVEEKAKDVVCIYRNSEGKIVFSTTIPFYTNLTEVLKECLTAWLKTMLQLDPARRGRKIAFEQKSGGANDGPSSTSDLVNLKLLSGTLATKFLEIQAIKEKLAFPIGQTGQTKIADIQQKIAVKTSLIPDNQLILTADGVEVLKTDVASKYIGMDLYLVPRCVDLIRMKVRFPTTVNNFILQWDTVKDPTKLRKVWACAIFYLQSELRKIETVKKIVQALKAWCIVNYTNKIKMLQIDIEKAGSSLGTVLELEGRLESIDDQYSDAKKSLDLNINVGECGQRGSRHWTEEMSKLHNHYRSCFDPWVETVAFKPVTTTELEELYYKVLKACSDWKSSDSNSTPFCYTEVLLRSVCQFIVKGNEIDDALLFNIRTQFDKIRLDMTLMEEMKSVVTKLNQLTADILLQRCAKQTLMVQILNGTDLPTVSSSITSVTDLNDNQKENSPPNSSRVTTPTTNPPSTYSVRGGGYRSARMSQSTLPSTSQETGVTDANVGPKMAVSLSTGLRNMDQCPLVTMLMQESQNLKFRTEESINSLNGSMEEIKEIRKEQGGIKWDFLKE